VVVVADRDEPRCRAARKLAASLLGIATSVRLVESAEGKDAFEAGLSLDELEEVDGWPVQRAQELQLIGADDLEVLVDEDVVGPVDADVVDLVLAVAQLDNTVDDAP
jgi:hypothetical protein